MFRFAHTEDFVLLLVVVILGGIYIFRTLRRRHDLKLLGDPQLISSLMPDYSRFRNNLKTGILLLGLVFLILALAEPQFGSKLTEVRRKGIEIIVALDVSNSMLAQDIKPSRLERAKQELSNLMDKLDNDRIGLIVFAGDAYTEIPITSDYLSAKMFLAGINPGMVSRQGTNIGSAIDLAMKSFSPDTKASKAIVIISDGENLQGDVLPKCKEAAKEGITIFTIGMGLPEGARIPIPSRPGNQDFMRDKEGNFIITRLNEQMLSDIASTGGGQYYRADSPNMGLRLMLARLRKMNKAEMNYKVYSDYEEQFPLFIWIVLALFWLDFLVLERKNKWLRKIRLF